jgi:hypothetical protein
MADVLFGYRRQQAIASQEKNFVASGNMRETKIDPDLVFQGHSVPIFPLSFFRDCRRPKSFRLARLFSNPCQRKTGTKLFLPESSWRSNIARDVLRRRSPHLTILLPVLPRYCSGQSDHPGYSIPLVSHSPAVAADKECFPTDTASIR